MMEKDLESGVITKRGIRIVKGKGSRIWDDKGKEFLDMGASYGVCNAGHSPDGIAEALRLQASELVYISSSYDNPTRLKLMERLIEISPFEKARVFLCNSGSEAVEAALKFSIELTRRSKVIAMKGSFHGRTMGALSLTHSPKNRNGYESFLGRVDFVTYGDIGELRSLIDDNTAAVILEPIQGEGGVRIPPDDYIGTVCRICRENGTLLIVDEVQTGMGRTGKMFAIEREGIIPDILCVGKSLGGGVPIAATLLREEIGSLDKGRHGSTFGGSPITCSAAIVTIDLLDRDEVHQRTEELSRVFLEGLRSIDHPFIKEVRGRGLMIGVELKRRVGPYLSALLMEGIAAIPSGSNVIRFLPPLVVTNEEIDRTVEVFSRVLHEG